jgi:predicted Zn-dependent protease
MYRGLAIAFGAGLVIVALGPRPRAQTFDRQLTRAAIAAAAGQPAAAVTALDQALAFDPALASLHLAAARLAVQAGDPAAARRHLEAAPLESRQSEAFDCLMESLPEAEAVDDVMPRPSCLETERTVEDQGGILTLAELRDEADALRERLLDGPQELGVWERLSALTEITDPAATEAALLQAYRFYPGGSELLDGLWAISHDDSPLSAAEREAYAGQLLASEGDWALAGAAWGRAIALEPRFAQARAYLGLATSRTGGDGLPHLLTASADAPDDPIVRSLLGQYWLATGDPYGAVRELAYAHRLDTANPAIAAALGEALAQTGRLADAAEAYLLAATHEPQDPSFWLLLAEFSLRYDYQVDSIGLNAARNSVSLSPEDPAALSALGMANMLAGDATTAERQLQQAITLDPADALAWYRYALILLDQARLDEAQQALETAYRLDPEGRVGTLAGAARLNLSAGFQ